LEGQTRQQLFGSFVDEFLAAQLWNMWRWHAARSMTVGLGNYPMYVDFGRRQFDR
jgi:uncharacterized membrane protein